MHMILQIKTIIKRKLAFVIPTDNGFFLGLTNQHNYRPLLSLFAILVIQLKNSVFFSNTVILFIVFFRKKKKKNEESKNKTTLRKKRGTLKEGH